MKFRSTLTILFILAFLVGCAPQSTPVSVEPAPATATQPPVVEEATAPTPEPVATSRGDQLVATDPASVTLATGKPYLVEFFRFT